MIGIGEIKINAEGKSEEDIKKEIMDQVGEQVDKMFAKRKKKEEKKKEEKPMAKFHILLDESEDRTGFNCQVETEGMYNELMSMLVCGVSSALKSINEKRNPMDVIEFGSLLMKEYMGMNDDEDGEEDE